MGHRQLVGFLAIAASVLLVLGAIYTLGVYGNSRWTGLFLLFSGAAGMSLAVSARRVHHARVERDPVSASPTPTADAPPAGLRWYPLLTGLIFFTVGTLSEDIAVGVIAGLGGLAFGWLAIVPIEKRDRGGKPKRSRTSSEDV